MRLCRICDEYDEIDGEEEQGNAIARSSALAHERETETERDRERQRERERDVIDSYYSSVFDKDCMSMSVSMREYV